MSGAVARVARAAGIERVRCTLEERLWRRGLPPAAAASRLVRVGLARRFRAELERAGLRSPGRVFDLRELMADSGAQERRALLRREGIVTEMFCHPGTEAADREKPGSCVRADESRFLRSAEFRDLLADAGVTLVTYWEV